MSNPIEENNWLIDLILSFFHSMEWKAPVLSYIETHCVSFDDEDENKLEYTKIHKDFKDLTEGLIEGMFTELGTSNELFAEAYEAAEQTKGFKKIGKILKSIDDFTVFKKMMVKKNRDLNEEAMQMMLAKEISSKMQEPGLTKPTPTEPTPEPGKEELKKAKLES